MEAYEQGPQGGALLGRAGVGRLAPGIEASLVADADGVAVVPLAVCADDCLAAAWLDGSVTTDDVVVADGFPASGAVPLVYLGCRAGLRGLHGRAMDDEKGNGSHIVHTDNLFVIMSHGNPGDYDVTRKSRKSQKAALGVMSHGDYYVTRKSRGL